MTTVDSRPSSSPLLLPLDRISTSTSSTPSTSASASASPSPPRPLLPPQNIIHFSHDSAPDDFPNTSHKGFVVIDGPPQHQLLDVPPHDPMNTHSAGQEAIIVMESGDENQQWYQEGDNHELKRVKVYELVSSRWVDQGTAFCFGHYDEPTSEALLIARAETDYNNVILQTTIRSSDVYQHQQDTLIVWTEPDGVDFALSFQDPDGCSEVWNFITEVQRIHSTISEEQHGESSSPFSGPEPSITTASIIRSGHLPQPALGIIPEIDRAIKTLSRTASIKEKICEYIQRADYLKAMIDVMHQAEDLESLENLHPLCMLMQTILMMNDHSMYEHIIEDDIFFGVIGMLEYDPEFPDHKANYREFLRESTHFHQPVPVHEPAIEKKIHHTYRLQFLKDVVLARALDDSTFNVLNSCIIFNQIDILSHVQNHPQFLKGITNLFVSEDGSAAKKDGAPMDVDPTDADKPKRNGAPSGANGVAEVPSKSPDQDEASLPQRRREVVLLIQQLCIMGKNVQLPTRMALFKLIVDRGVVHAIQWALSLPETTPEGQQMIAVAGEVFMTLLDHDVNGVREHIVRQCEQNTASGAKDESLLLSLCAIMVRSRDLAVQTLVGDALRMLLEMPIADSNEAIVPSKLFSRTRDDAKVEKFLDYFYKLCISTLLKPIFDIPDRKQASDWILGLTREKTNLYLSLCDLLSTFALQHSFRSHFFMLTTNTSAHVATLLLAKDKHLRLAALRYFRAHLKNKNRNFLAHLMKVDLFKPILELSLFESRRDTLVNSSCQEFFEYMRRENVKEAIAHVMTTQEAMVKQLSETRYSGQCFTALIRRWEMNTAPQPLEEEEKPPPHQPFEVRRLDLAEESYFNTSDDDDDDDEIGPSPALLSTPPVSRYHLQIAQKRKRNRMTGVPVRAARPQSIHLPRTPPIGSLVDYGEDEDDDNEDEDNGRSPPASTDGGDTDASDGPNGPRAIPPRAQTPTPTAKRARDEDGDGDGDEDEDDVLDRLAGFKPPRSSPGGGFTPFRPEKRRRGDEDEDELSLERLATKAKRPGFGLGLTAGGAKEGVGVGVGGGGRPGTPKPGVGGGGGDEGPKKIKLKFMSLSAAAAGAAPSSRSEPGAKDGDIG